MWSVAGNATAGPSSTIRTFSLGRWGPRQMQICKQRVSITCSQCTQPSPSTLGRRGRRGCIEGGWRWRARKLTLSGPLHPSQCARVLFYAKETNRRARPACGTSSEGGATRRRGPVRVGDSGRIGGAIALVIDVAGRGDAYVGCLEVCKARGGPRTDG